MEQGGIQVLYNPRVRAREKRLGISLEVRSSVERKKKAVNWLGVRWNRGQPGAMFHAKAWEEGSVYLGRAR